VKTLLINTINLSHSTQKAGGTVFRKHTVELSKNIECFSHNSFQIFQILFFATYKKNTILKNSKKDKILEEIFREDLKNIDYSKSETEV